MKILQKATMKNGTTLQREEWSENYSFMAYGATVAAYPISKESINRPFEPKIGEKFRLAMHFENTEEAEKCFEQLKNGEKALKDFRRNFDNPDRIICI